MARFKKGTSGERGWQVVVCCACGFRREANGVPSDWLRLRSGKAVCGCAAAKRPAKQVAA